MQEFTLEDWANSRREIVPFEVPEEIRVKLEKMAEEITTLCVANGVPIFLVMVTAQDEDCCSLSSSNNFTPTGRVPAELLAAFTTVQDGLSNAPLVIDALMGAM